MSRATDSKAETKAAGMKVRRQILGDAHVDNTAFRLLAEVIDELRGKGVKINGAVE